MDSENGTEVTLHLYSIENPQWHQVIENHMEAITGFITQGGWTVVNKKRRGFLNCKRLENIIYGYYAQEGELHIEQFDDNQQPKEDEQRSFERILFLLFLVEGMVVVQSTRIAKYIDLSGPALRSGLFNLLDTMFKKAGFSYKGKADFERYKHEYSRDQLIRIFEEHNIQRLIVRDLYNSKVPENLRLFNPDFDADGFLKTVIENDLKKSEQVEWTGQEIQKTKIARGLLYAGNPQLLEGIDEYGEQREWEASTPQTLTMELNTNNIHFPEEDLRKVLALFRRRFGLFDDRISKLKAKQQDENNLPLFSQGSE